MSVSINLFRNWRETASFPAGAVVFHEGDRGEAMYAVLEGSVEIAHQGRVVEALAPGGIFGELALIDEAPRSATVTATTDTTLAVIGARDFTYLVQDHPTFALQVMRTMAERLRAANTGSSRDGARATTA